MVATIEQKKRKAAAPPTSSTAKKPKTSTSSSVKATKAKPTTRASALSNTAELDDKVTFNDVEPSSESEDDQTAALLKGFESPLESEDDEAHNPKQDPADAILDISALPNPSDAVIKSKSKTKSGAVGNASAPTTLYISRIPHGFYEPQMKAYFSQFGEIKRLRMARNRRTGASKHYAFIEFDSAEVARIVQQTMDNYLMFKHILKVRLVPREQIHEELWKGAGRRFRKVPWNRIEKTRVAQTDREGWDKRLKNESKRREEKAAKLKALGYEFEAPALRAVDSVPVREPNKPSDDEGEHKKIEDQKDALDLHAIPTETVKTVEITKTTAGRSAGITGKPKKTKAIKLSEK